MEKKNVIPRKFAFINAQALEDIGTTIKAGDIFHIYRNDCGLLGLNMRTGKYGYFLVSALRNGNLFKIRRIEKEVD